MSKSEAADLVVAARKRKGLTWARIAEELGTPLVWTTAALLGQHPMTAEQAAKAKLLPVISSEAIDQSPTVH